MPLPSVTPDGHGDMPFIVASKNPNGCISISTLARIRNRLYWTPRCNISIDAGEAATFGIFGYYNALIIFTALDLSDAVILAQDLAGNTVKNITSLVTINNKSLIIPGDGLEQAGSGEQTGGDTSEPGLVLVISFS